MNKTNYIILALALCFSIAFVAYPLRIFAGVNGPGEPGYTPPATSPPATSPPATSPPATSPPATSPPANGGNGGNGNGNGDDGLTESWDLGDTADNGDDWLDVPGEAEIGDTFTGSSGTTYELQEENLTPEEQAYYEENGFSTDGVWVEVNGNGNGNGNDNGNGNGNGNGPPPVEEPPNGGNGDGNGLPTTATTICGCVVVSSYTPCSSDSVCVGGTSSNGWTPPASPPPTSPPPPPEPKCQIFEFSINGKTNEDRDPLFVWVNASLKGYISVNDSCTTCTVTSDDVWGNPPKAYTITSLSTYITELFKIPTSGIYSFTLSCIGDPADPDDFDEDTTSLQTVEALNLPWWREIIPVLQGSLFSFWPWK